MARTLTTSTAGDCTNQPPAGRPEPTPGVIVNQTDPTETARVLLDRYGLPEDVIDGALCLHAQELAAVQRREADDLHQTEPGVVRGLRIGADLIDPTKPAAAPAVFPGPLSRAAEFELRGTAEIQAAALLEAADALHGRAQHLTGEFNNSDILHEDGPAATVATWKRAADLLRRLAAEAPQQNPETRCPHGCDVSRCPCLACEADAAQQQPATEADEIALLRLTLEAVEEGRRELRANIAQLRSKLWTLTAIFEGFGRLLATSSRDWGQYAPDAWLYAVILGWDCEEAVHDETCTHGAMEEMQQRHGWDDKTVAKARRFRAVVHTLTAPATPVQQPAAADSEETQS